MSNMSLSRMRLPLFASPLLVGGCALSTSPMTILAPKSDLGLLLHDLFVGITGWIVLIFLVVEALLVGVLLFYRDRPGRTEPKPVHGHLGIEIAWTLVPVFIVGAIAVPTVRTIALIEAPSPLTAVRIEVIGHQWWWEIRYPDLRVVTANELHLPTGQPVRLLLTSADVIHSFWIPQVGGKRDLIPGTTTQLAFTVETPGTYPGQCAEFCGLSHANMRLLTIAEPSQQFQAWATQQQRRPTAVADELAQRGAQALLAGGCIACHAIQGLSTASLGPDLTHVGGRRTLAAGLLPNEPVELARWLRDPAQVKPGAQMPTLPLTDEQVSTIVAYLGALQ